MNNYTTNRFNFLYFVVFKERNLFSKRFLNKCIVELYLLNNKIRGKN